MPQIEVNAWQFTILIFLYSFSWPHSDVFVWFFVNQSDSFPLALVTTMKALNWTAKKSISIVQELLQARLWLPAIKIVNVFLI